MSFEDVVQRALDGEELSDDDLDLVFDVAGVSTGEQLVALAKAHGWDRRMPVTYRAYVVAFERWFRSRSSEDWLRWRQAFVEMIGARS